MFVISISVAEDVIVQVRKDLEEKDCKQPKALVMQTSGQDKG